MNDEYTQRFTDPRPTKELIKAALEEEDADRYWEIVGILRLRGTKEELDAALALCKSEVVEEKRLGAQILGQLGGSKGRFVSESIDVLYYMLEYDKNPYVLESAAIAVGDLHPEDSRAVELIAGLKDHPEADVRFGVAVGLLGYQDDLAINTLIELSSDEDAETRDYATMGIGQLTEADTPEIRAALWERVTDEDHSVRGEGILGLALRNDERAFDLVLHELETRGQATEAAVEAAKALANLKLCSALLALKQDPEVSTYFLDLALAACGCENPTN